MPVAAAPRGPAPGRPVLCSCDVAGASAMRCGPRPRARSLRRCAAIRPLGKIGPTVKGPLASHGGAGSTVEEPPPQYAHGLRSAIAGRRGSRSRLCVSAEVVAARSRCAIVMALEDVLWAHFPQWPPPYVRVAAIILADNGFDDVDCLRLDDPTRLVGYASLPDELKVGVQLAVEALQRGQEVPLTPPGSPRTPRSPVCASPSGRRGAA